MHAATATRVTTYAATITIEGRTIVLAGDVDVRSTMRVRAALHDLLSLHQHVVVDLSEVSSVDTTALRVLAAASMRAARGGRHVSLRGCNGAVRRLLHLTHLIRLVDLDREPVPA